MPARYHTKAPNKFEWVLLCQWTLMDHFRSRGSREWIGIKVKVCWLALHVQGGAKVSTTPFFVR